MAMKMTKWFPPGINPVHIGEYNASVNRDPDTRRWWDGKRWSILLNGAKGAERERRRCSPRFVFKDGLQIEWRGLAKKPR